MNAMGGRGSGRRVDPKQEFYILEVMRKTFQKNGETGPARGVAKRQRQIVAANKQRAATERKAQQAKKNGGKK